MTKLLAVLKQHTDQFHKVINYTPTDKFALLNLSASNTKLTNDIYSNTTLFTEYIEKEKLANNAQFLIGGYAEIRDLYNRSILFNVVKQHHFNNEKINTNENKIAEPRRLHLGIDIWGNATTKVYTPLGGVVHSFANNNKFGDYGATIILQHQINTQVFYTLYGHLSLIDIEKIKIGQFIARGQCIAHFGNSLENGNWPPHLHFQIIEDMERNEGDYPGVCRLSDKEKYLHNCPNADLILNMMKLIV